MVDCGLYHLELAYLSCNSQVLHINLYYLQLEDTTAVSGSVQFARILILILPLIHQVFNPSFYDIIDSRLLDAYMRLIWLALSINLNDFVHANCT